MDFVRTVGRFSAESPPIQGPRRFWVQLAFSLWQYMATIRQTFSEIKQRLLYIRTCAKCAAKDGCVPEQILKGALAAFVLYDHS